MYCCNEERWGINIFNLTEGKAHNQQADRPRYLWGVSVDDSTQTHTQTHVSFPHHRTTNILLVLYKKKSAKKKVSHVFYTALVISKNAHTSIFFPPATAVAQNYKKPRYLEATSNVCNVYTAPISHKQTQPQTRCRRQPAITECCMPCRRWHHTTVIICFRQ